MREEDKTKKWHIRVMRLGTVQEAKLGAPC